MKDTFDVDENKIKKMVEEYELQNQVCSICKEKYIA